MPWTKTAPMNERMRFVTDWERGQFSEPGGRPAFGDKVPASSLRFHVDDYFRELAFAAAAALSAPSDGPAIRLDGVLDPASFVWVRVRLIADTHYSW